MKKSMKEIKKEVFDTLTNTSEMSEEKMKDHMIDYFFLNENYHGSSYYEKKQIIQQLMDETFGFGMAECLIKDPDISEIMINGRTIFYEKKGEMKRFYKEIENDNEIERMIELICEQSNRSVNLSSPIVDACLPDGTRANIVLDPISVNGHAITLRKFPEKPLTYQDMITNGFFDKEVYQFLDQAIKAKYNIFICGGAGTGKTTLLNVLVGSIQKEQRLITIEDSAELNIVGLDNHIRLETRNKNIEGQGGVQIRDLIRSSLRMRPDRIVVGEVRGAEALDMLQAMNTGHDGSLSTGHANSPRDMISRLETMVLMGNSLPLEAVHKQIGQAIDLFVFIQKIGKKRVLYEICEVCMEETTIKLNPLYRYHHEKKKWIQIGQMKQMEKIKRMNYEKSIS